MAYSLKYVCPLSNLKFPMAAVSIITGLEAILARSREEGVMLWRRVMVVEMRVWS